MLTIMYNIIYKPGLCIYLDPLVWKTIYEFVVPLVANLSERHMTHDGWKQEVDLYKTH